MIEKLAGGVIPSAVVRTEAGRDSAAIRHAAGRCLTRVDLSRRLRLLGVRAGTLVRL